MRTNIEPSDNNKDDRLPTDSNEPNMASTNRTRNRQYENIKSIKVDFQEQKKHKRSFLETKPPSFISICFSIVMFVISAIIAFLLLENYGLNPNANYSEDTIFIIFIGYYFTLFLVCFFLSDFILKFIAYTSKRKEQRCSFISLVIMANIWSMRFLISGFLFIILFNFIFNYKNHQYTNNSEAQIEDKTSEAAENLAKKTPLEKSVYDWERQAKRINDYQSTILLFLVAFMIESLARQYIRYRVHYEYYENDRNILGEQSRDLTEIIEQTGISHFKNTIEMINKLFDFYVEPGSKNLVREDFIKYFSEEKGNKFFELFDVNLDNLVSRKEFLLRYEDLISRNEHLVKCMEESDKTLGKLKLITYPITIFISISLTSAKSDTTSTPGIFTAFFSLSFMLGPPLANLFGNIFAIFFARPFDLNDLIIFQDKMYVVHDLGFLYTEFIRDDKIYKISNNLIRKTTIINLRNSSMLSVVIPMKFVYEEFNDQEEAFIRKIRDFLQQNKRNFSSLFYVSDYKIRDGKISISVKIFIYLLKNDINFLDKKKSEFVVALEKICKDLNLINRS